MGMVFSGNMDKNKILRTWLPASVGLLLALGLGVRFSFLATDTVAPGVRLAGVDLSGAKRGEVKGRLKNWAHQHVNDRITLEAGSRHWSGTLAGLGVRPDFVEIEQVAFQVGRAAPSPFTRFAEVMGLAGRERIPPAYRVSRRRIAPVLDKIEKATAVPAKDAELRFDDGVRTIVPEVYGTTIDKESACGAIEAAAASGQGVVPLSLVQSNPDVTAADLAQVDTVLASFTTVFPAWRRDRTHNVKLAVSRIDGSLVKPGEVFSYNQAVGPRQKKNGFRDALIYENGVVTPGTGGGVCQVSTTVYNAALLSNMQIVERTHHSMPVPYVPLGRDATVSYGRLDLRFRNTTSAPVYVTAKIARNRLTVQVYGAGKDKKDVKIVMARSKDRKMAVTVYRVVKENGIEVARTRISYDRYKPVGPHVPAKPKPTPA